MVKKHIILRKRANPKVVNLPDGRFFTSRWERISRKQLHINIKVTRKRTIGPRRNNRAIYLNQAAPAFKKIQRRRKREVLDRLGPVYDRVQGGGRLVSNLARAGLELGSKTIGSEFGRKLINKGIDNIPNIFKFGASKIKNKNIQRPINSEIVNMIVDEVQNRVKNKYDNLFE